MKIEIIKHDLEKYSAGDILSIYNAFQNDSKTFLLFEDTLSNTIGAFNLDTGLVSTKFTKDKSSFEDVIDRCRSFIDATEFHVFKNKEVKLILGG